MAVTTRLLKYREVLVVKTSATVDWVNFDDRSYLEPLRMDVLEVLETAEADSLR